MDKIDRLILSEIAEDCRTPLSSIGKKIRKSPQFVKYRLENLKQSEIKRIPVILDFYKLGNYEVTALIKFKIIDPLTEKILIDQLIKMIETYKLVYLNGEWDLLCSFIVKDLEKIEDIRKDITCTADVNITFLVNHETRIYGLNYLGESPSEKIIVLQKGNAQSDMNPEEKKVLAEIQKNPFSSLLEISQNTGSTYEKTKYAFSNSKIFMGNTLVISELEIKRSLILLNAKNIHFLGSYCSSDKNIVESNLLIGEYNCYLIIESETDIKHICKKIIYDLKDCITEYTALDANQFYKYGWFGL